MCCPKRVGPEFSSRCMSVWMSSLVVGAELALELASSPSLSSLSARGSVAGFFPGSLWRNRPLKGGGICFRLLKALLLPGIIVGYNYKIASVSGREQKVERINIRETDLLQKIGGKYYDVNLAAFELPVGVSLSGFHLHLNRLAPGVCLKRDEQA